MLLLNVSFRVISMKVFNRQAIDLCFTEVRPSPPDWVFRKRMCSSGLKSMSAYSQRFIDEFMFLKSPSLRLMVWQRYQTLLSAYVLMDKGLAVSGINLPARQAPHVSATLLLKSDPFVCLVFCQEQHSWTPTMSRVSVNFISGVGISFCFSRVFHFPKGRNLHLFVEGSLCNLVPSMILKHSSGIWFEVCQQPHTKY